MLLLINAISALIGLPVMFHLFLQSHRLLLQLSFLTFKVVVIVMKNASNVYVLLAVRTTAMKDSRFKEVEVV